MKYESLSSVASYAESVTSVAQQLNNFWHSVGDEFAVIMLCGLSDSFSPFIKSIAINYKGKLSSRISIKGWKQLLRVRVVTES